jgi:hypothetical protein
MASSASSSVELRGIQLELDSLRDALEARLHGGPQRNEAPAGRSTRAIAAVLHRESRDAHVEGYIGDNAHTVVFSPSQRGAPSTPLGDSRASPPPPPSPAPPPLLLYASPGMLDAVGAPGSFHVGLKDRMRAFIDRDRSMLSLAGGDMVTADEGAGARAGLEAAASAPPSVSGNRRDGGLPHTGDTLDSPGGFTATLDRVERALTAARGKGRGGAREVQELSVLVMQLARRIAERRRETADAGVGDDDAPGDARSDGREPRSERSDGDRGAAAIARARVDVRDGATLTDPDDGAGTQRRSLDNAPMTVLCAQGVPTVTCEMQLQRSTMRMVCRMRVRAVCVRDTAAYRACGDR